ncbi:MAG: DUF790 family protein [Isosphaeraceae bacterium]|nr:DUF790 family protein [Isosphaeraceae bacterium]
MLSGTLVRVKQVKGRVVPLYLPVDQTEWLEVAESLLMIFREGVGRTRLELEEEIDELVGEGLATLAHRGLAKVLEDRAEFEVVSDADPETIRRAVFDASAETRRSARAAGHRAPFRRDQVLSAVAERLAITTEQVEASLFADLKEENRLLRFEELDATKLIERYNVELARAVLLRATAIEIEIRREPPDRIRRLLRRLKFHRLLHRIVRAEEGVCSIHVDGPMSLFSATNKYGLQMALFLPALLQCSEFRLKAELRWGPKREPRTFQLDSSDRLVSHYDDPGSYVPAEIVAFVERLRQVAPDWEPSESTALVDLGGEATWVPDYRFVHKPSGIDVYVEILGFWKRSSVERLLRLLPVHGPARYVLFLSERLKVDEEVLDRLDGPVLRFKEIPNAVEFAAILAKFAKGVGEEVASVSPGS